MLSEKIPFFFSLPPRSFFFAFAFGSMSRRGELPADGAGEDFRRFPRLGERNGEEGATLSCLRASELLDRGGGVADPVGVRVLREAVGEMLGVAKGDGVGVASRVEEGLRGGVGVNCCEEKPESWEMRLASPPSSPAAG